MTSGLKRGSGLLALGAAVLLGASCSSPAATSGDALQPEQALERVESFFGSDAQCQLFPPTPDGWSFLDCQAPEAAGTEIQVLIMVAEGSGGFGDGSWQNTCEDNPKFLDAIEGRYVAIGPNWFATSVTRDDEDEILPVAEALGGQTLTQGELCDKGKPSGWMTAP